jgi:hypothetical protein
VWARFRALRVASLGRGGLNSRTKQRFPYNRLSLGSCNRKKSKGTRRRRALSILTKLWLGRIGGQRSRAVSSGTLPSPALMHS